MDRRKKKIYCLIIILAVLILGLFFIPYSISLKEKNLQLGGESKIFDFGNDVGEKKVFLQFSDNRGKLYVKKNFYSYCYISLSGFEQSAVVNQLSIGHDQLKIIEVSGYVGAHSENRQYFYLDSNLCPKAITFEKEGELSYNIFSDEPNFILQDDDGLINLIVEFRNWDTDPISETIRDRYFFESEKQKFIFAGSENFSYLNVLPDDNN
ncbi:MAG: hypothetical protein Athens101428_366 [Candidatus Berkelbacteria bacterium Athens1014_28]|uniref:Uncharacterized protein n=1 Tax=Candidatus Berkelbacteria bacterium Athens1014_28 TaxID=2017145 RepID=A0A554LN69_9BACT|nr:MAG: hypothetical protein Athens101428_366 [Candidatus Berkelbacteria bacterium Athens1014_28]